MTKKILFVCTYWGVRSQIAALLTDALEVPGLIAESAGFEDGTIGKLPIQAMSGRELFLSSTGPPTLFNFARRKENYDFVVTLCNQETHENYQILYDVVDTLFSKRAQIINWNVADFMAIGDLPQDARLGAANKIIDDIECYVLSLINDIYHFPSADVP